MPSAPFSTASLAYYNPNLDFFLKSYVEIPLVFIATNTFLPSYSKISSPVFNILGDSNIFGAFSDSFLSYCFFILLYRNL